MGIWVHPTGNENNQWADTENMYDNNTGTFGWSSTNSNATTLTRSAVNCSKIRIHSGRGAGGQSDLTIELYYNGEFQPFYDGALTEDTWQEIAIGTTESVSKVRITMNDGIETEVAEVELWDVDGSLPTYPEGASVTNTYYYG